MIPLAVWALHPKAAAVLAAALLGRIDIAPDLIGICQRESRCAAVSVHERDAHLSRRGWRGQVRLGHLDPECQPYKARAWATRGPWGLSAASHWEYLPRCYSPAILDVPLVSALIAARKWIRHCDGRRSRAWC